MVNKWSQYRNRARLADVQHMEQLNAAQIKALNELRAVSEDLYQEAVQPDLAFVPFYADVVVSTPPIEKYDSPDGEYVDTSKKWE